MDLPEENWGTLYFSLINSWTSNFRLKLLTKDFNIFRSNFAHIVFRSIGYKIALTVGKITKNCFHSSLVPVYILYESSKKNIRRSFWKKSASINVDHCSEEYVQMCTNIFPFRIFKDIWCLLLTLKRVHVQVRLIGFSKSVTQGNLIRYSFSCFVAKSNWPIQRFEFGFWGPNQSWIKNFTNFPNSATPRNSYSACSIFSALSPETGERSNLGLK